MPVGTPLPPKKKVDFSCLCFCSTLDDTVLTLAAGSWMFVHVAFPVGARQTPRPEPGTVGDSKCTEIKKEPFVFPRSVSPSGTRSGWDALRVGRPGRASRETRGKRASHPRRRSLRALRVTTGRGAAPATPAGLDRPKPSPPASARVLRACLACATRGPAQRRACARVGSFGARRSRGAGPA